MLTPSTKQNCKRIGLLNEGNWPNLICQYNYVIAYFCVQEQQKEYNKIFGSLVLKSRLTNTEAIKNIVPNYFVIKF